MSSKKGPKVRFNKTPELRLLKAIAIVLYGQGVKDKEVLWERVRTVFPTITKHTLGRAIELEDLVLSVKATQRGAELTRGSLLNRGSHGNMEGTKYYKEREAVAIEIAHVVDFLKTDIPSPKKKKKDTKVQEDNHALQEDQPDKDDIEILKERCAVNSRNTAKVILLLAKMKKDLNRVQNLVSSLEFRVDELAGR